MKREPAAWIVSALMLAGEASAELVGHFGFNGDFGDSAPAGANPVGAPGGDAAFTNAARAGSHALALDGAGDSVNVGDVFDIGVGNLTVAAWIRTTNKAFARIVAKEGTGGFNLSVHATDGVGCMLGTTYQYFKATYEDGTFHHLAAVFDRNNGIATVYWDGAALGGFDISTYDGVDLNNAAGLYIGWRSTGGTGAFKGIIDDVRIYDEALTAEGVRELSRFSAHFTFDGHTANSASNGPGPVGELAGDAAYTDAARVGSQALALDGDGDYAVFGDDFDIGTFDWTVSLWMKTSTKKFARLATKSTWALATGSVGDLSVTLDGGAWGGTYQFHTFQLPSGTYHDGRFHHLATVFDRDGMVTMYWDGVAIGSKDISTNAAVDIRDSWPLMVGARYNNGSPDATFEGVIDDVRIDNAALSAEEIQRRAEYAFAARTAARYGFDGNADNSEADGPRPSGTLFGDAAYTTEAKTGTQALALDGSGDYVRLDDVFDIGTNDLTVAAWVKTTNKAFARIVAKEGAGGFNLSLHATDGVGCTLGTTYQYFKATYEDGTFHHLAAVFDRDGYATVYWDGEALGAFDISAYNGTDLNTPNSLCIGWRSTGGTGAFKGIIDDVRLFGRVLTRDEIKGLFPPPKGTLLRVQ